MNKKAINAIILGATTLVLGACVSNQEVAKVGSDKITQDVLYQELKKEYGTSVLQDMLVLNVLNKFYGEAVTDEDVETAYVDVVSNFGGLDNFKASLSYYGFSDVDDYKKSLKKDLLIQEMVKDTTKVTDKEIEEYKAVLIDFDVIRTGDEKLTIELGSKIEKETDLNALVSENERKDEIYVQSTGEYKDVRDTTSLPEEVLKVVESLAEGTTSKEPVATETGYYIVRVNKRLDSKELKEAEVKQIVTDFVLSLKGSDNSYITKELSKLLKKENVVVSDQELAKELEDFLNLANETTSGGTNEDKAKELESQAEAESSSETTEGSESTETSKDTKDIK